MYDGNWHHVTYVMRNNANVLYVDGLQEDIDAGDLDTTTDEFDMGVRPFGSNPYKGVLDDVRIYNRALSPAEIQQLYQLGGVKITQ